MERMLFVWRKYCSKEENLATHTERENMIDMYSLLFDICVIYDHSGLFKRKREISQVEEDGVVNGLKR
jgi:hypothetical protein